MARYHNSSGESTVNFDGADMWYSSLRNFAGLTGALLLVGILANAYLLWLTGRRRFPVQWETARLNLRYSSVIDLSLCLVLASVLLRPCVIFHTGSDVSLALSCVRFDVVVSYFGFVLVGSGVVVVCRQMCMMHTFQHETSLMKQHGGRTVQLRRDVVVAGAVCVVGYLILPRFAPDINLAWCFVNGSLTSRTVYLFIFPVAVNVILGVIVVARATRPEVDAKRHHSKQTTGGDLTEKATLSLPSHDLENGLDKITQSRWNRFVIVASVSVLTWFVLVAALALADVLIQPSSGGTVFVMVSVSALQSAWSAFAAFRYWT